MSGQIFLSKQKVSYVLGFTLSFFRFTLLASFFALSLQEFFLCILTHARREYKVCTHPKQHSMVRCLAEIKAWILWEWKVLFIHSTIQGLGQNTELATFHPKSTFLTLELCLTNSTLNFRAKGTEVVTIWSQTHFTNL